MYCVLTEVRQLDKGWESCYWHVENNAIVYVWLM